MSKNIIVALTGNPNSGKTTIFNEITGARQHVGNYPGVTVERKDGKRNYKGTEMLVVDLPGTYSISSSSAEELITRNFIIDEKPDVVVDIVDSSNLERSLYLAVQLKELNVPLVIVLNMTDMAKRKGYEINKEIIGGYFDAYVVETVGNKGVGVDELLDTILKSHSKKQFIKTEIQYGKDLDSEILKVQKLIEADKSITLKYNAKWSAIKLLENDVEINKRLESSDISSQLRESKMRIESILGDSPEIEIAASRYGFISGVCQQAVKSTIEFRHSISDKIDTIVMNRLLGIPIFLGLMYLVFHLTFTIGEPPMGWIEATFEWLSGVIGGLWSDGSESILRSLILDGIIGGVGGVVIFLPNILLLFLAIAILEDTGYMARAAFIMDRFMHKLGLHGKSFIPMLIGFGCSVPAIMATRTLENRKDRLTTMLVAPLMSCGARLPIYALIIPAFFPETIQATMLWLIYVIGIALAIVCAKLLRGTILKGETVPFVMELPPFRMPTLKGIVIHTWARGKLYLVKAGTVILGISILLWAMTTFPSMPESKISEFAGERSRIELSNDSSEIKEEKLILLDNAEQEFSMRHSIAGRVGTAMEPVIKPMGFDWKIGTALIGAFAAKEVFVAQLGVVYSVGEADEESTSLREKLQANYNPLIGFCIMLFCLISAPCMATIAVTKRESNSWGWAMFQLLGLTVLAYIVTVIVYQVGMMLEIGVI